MNDCFNCKRKICEHGSHSIKVFSVQCIECKRKVDGREEDITSDTYHLPTKEGEVNFSSDVFSSFCPDCYFKELIKLRKKGVLPDEHEKLF